METSYYYLMDTSQKDLINPATLKSVPFPNIEESLWIIETTVPGLDCVTAFISNTECSIFVKSQLQEWDRDYELNF